jgi:hypothetical protein
MISLPSVANDCLGTSKKRDTINIASNKSREIKALLGKAAIDSILARLIDTPTNINPVSAAAAPAVATKKLLHISISCSFDTNVGNISRKINHAHFFTYVL